MTKCGIVALALVMAWSLPAVRAQEVVKLTAPAARSGDRFGYGVAVSGEVVLVGTGSGRGAYVYERLGGVWTLLAHLLPPNDTDSFGRSVALGDSLGAVTARSGAREFVHIIHRRDTTWATLTRWSVLDFGEPVAMDGSQVIAGHERSGGGGKRIGYVRFFRHVDSPVERQRSIASFRVFLEEAHAAGLSVAVSAPYALVGHWQEAYPAVYLGGGVFSLEEVDGTWVMESALPAPPGSGRFGRSVALYGDVALVGDPSDAAPGAVHVYRRTPDGWVRQARLTAPDGRPGDGFGTAVALHGDYALVGTGVEVAYLFRREGEDWTVAARWTPPGGSGYDRYGWSVALDDRHAVVGAYFDIEKAISAGAAFVYDLAPLATSAREPAVPPAGFRLDPAYPNPARHTATIPFTLPTAEAVTLDVFDLLGRRVARAANATLPPGRHDVTLDLQALPSGLYLYRLQAGPYAAAGQVRRF